MPTTSPSLRSDPGRPGPARRVGAVRSSAIRDLLAVTARPEIVSLAGGLPDPASFPARRLRRELGRLLRHHPETVLQYAPTEGHEPLRRLLAERIGHRWDRPVSPARILVTSGAQQGLDLVARVLFDPGATVVVEDPAYLGTLQAWGAAEATLVGVGVDRDGLDTDELERRLLAGLRPVAVSTVSAFHNPTGATLAVARRRHLALLAERYGFWIVDDDPYGELWFRTPPPAPVATLTDRVVSLGSFSKTVAPGVRCGWMVVPDELVGAVATMKQALDLQTATLVQPALTALLADAAAHEAHLDHLRHLYAERASALVASLARRLGGLVEVSAPAGGMFVWARFTDGTDAAALLPGALAEGVAYVPGIEFAVASDGPERGRLAGHLRLSFATNPPARLDEAVTRLARAVERG